MKKNGLESSLLSVHSDFKKNSLTHDEIGDNHYFSGIETPMVASAFDKTDEEKIDTIQFHFKKIMETLGLDLNDDSLKGTPSRVAKMYVNELFNGLNPSAKPKIALFENKYQYNEMLVEKDIEFYSNCEHHFVPFYGKAHLAYISSGKVIGLSKLNRVVNYFSKRPQVQERLTIQIAKELQQILDTDDVAIIIEAKHLCVSSRGIKDNSASTITSFYGGTFKIESVKAEFLTYISKPSSL